MGQGNFLPERFFSKGSKTLELFDWEAFVWKWLDELPGVLQRFDLGVHRTPLPKGVHLENPDEIYIAEGVHLEWGAYIQGPAVILAGAAIRHGAYVRAGCLIGEGAVVGHATEVKASLILDEAKLPHFAYIGDSVIGSRCNLASHVVCANYRLDGKVIEVFEDGKRFSTGRNKLGALVGEDVSIGCHALLNPGTCVARGAVLRPATTYSGVIQ